MNWVEREDSLIFEIRTGDGKTYRPVYMSPSKAIKLNSSILEFNNIPGALIKSGLYGYRTFDVKLLFHGENHLNTSASFEESCKNTSHWTVLHPLYGSILCRPIGKVVFDTKGNITTVTCELAETLTEKDLRVYFSAPILKEPEIKPLPTKPNISSLTKAQKIFAKIAKLKAGTESALKQINRSISDLERLIGTIGMNSTVYMAQLAYLARTPGRLYATTRDRIIAIRETYYDLLNSIIGLGNIANSAASLPLNDKRQFESIGVFSVLAMADAITIPKLKAGIDLDVPFPEAEPVSSTEEVLSDVIALISIYDNYINVLSYMQSEKDNRIDSYYPDYNFVKELSYYVAATCAKRLDNMETATIVYTHKLVTDTGITPLVYLLYGNTYPSTIARFLALNKFDSSELVLVKSGREVYYGK